MSCLLALSREFHLAPDEVLNEWWAWKFWLYVQIAPDVLRGPEEDPPKGKEDQKSIDDLVESGFLGRG